MARIPYVPADTAEPAALVAAIRARRGGALYNLDRALLHSPPLADGWNAFLGRVRSELALPAHLRELAICAVAIYNDAAYEFAHHLPVFRAAGGTEAQCTALATLTAATPDLAPFDAAERAVLAITRAMTEVVAVDEATFAAAADALGETRLVVELVAVVAAYNMVSRLLVALDIDLEDTSG